MKINISEVVRRLLPAYTVLSLHAGLNMQNALEIDVIEVIVAS
jgi:hypothetical protein